MHAREKKTGLRPLSLEGMNPTSVVVDATWLGISRSIPSLPYYPIYLNQMDMDILETKTFLLKTKNLTKKSWAFLRDSLCSMSSNHFFLHLGCSYCLIFFIPLLILICIWLAFHLQHAPGGLDRVMVPI